jgi:hypothetical protein
MPTSTTSGARSVPLSWVIALTSSWLLPFGLAEVILMPYLAVKPLMIVAVVGPVRRERDDVERALLLGRGDEGGHPAEVRSRGRRRRALAAGRRGRAGRAAGRRARGEREPGHRNSCEGQQPTRGTSQAHSHRLPLRSSSPGERVRGLFEIASTWPDPRPQRIRPEGSQGCSWDAADHPFARSSRPRHVDEAAVVALEGDGDVVVGPLRCLAMIRSASPARGSSPRRRPARCSRITMSASCSIDPDSRRSESIGACRCAARGHG